MSSTLDHEVHEIDLAELPKGSTYSDAYGAWLNIFRRVAETDGSIPIYNAPSSWAPLLTYLGANVWSVRAEFPCDHWLPHTVRMYENAKAQGRQREYVEHVCALRPELVDALWKSDCEWKTWRRDHTEQREFVVANYSAFYRPEIQDFMRRMQRYEKPFDAKYAVITNCSAEKPYPARLHSEILRAMPDDRWQLLIATGVLGVVPDELWNVMPLYDSGIPNFWRCMEAWEHFLARNEYKALVVYTEFYSRSLSRALALFAGKMRVHWVVPPGPYDGYLDLASTEWISRLKTSIVDVVNGV